jgi:hypothetical protein
MFNWYVNSAMFFRQNYLFVCLRRFKRQIFRVFSNVNCFCKHYKHPYNDKHGNVFELIFSSYYYLSYYLLTLTCSES